MLAYSIREMIFVFVPITLSLLGQQLLSITFLPHRNYLGELDLLIELT